MKYVACILLSTHLLAVQSLADSWSFPSTKEYFSENKEYRLTVPGQRRAQ